MSKHTSGEEVGAPSHTKPKQTGQGRQPRAGGERPNPRKDGGHGGQTPHPSPQTAAAAAQEEPREAGNSEPPPRAFDAVPKAREVCRSSQPWNRTERPVSTGPAGHQTRSRRIEAQNLQPGNLPGDFFREICPGISSGKFARNFFREICPEISSGKFARKFLPGNLPGNLLGPHQAHRKFRRGGGFSRSHLVSRGGQKPILKMPGVSPSVHLRYLQL